MTRFGIVAGEASGDLLAADLIKALKVHYPDAEFYGIAGPKMMAQGCQSLYAMERLSVMGLAEVLGRYRELRTIQRELIHTFCDNPPDAFIGVDAPDFNLGIETQLKAQAIPTIHYVSPSVWAWRKYRVKKIARATDLMLTLFPFEAQFYQQHQIAVNYVGHPLADMIPMQTDPQQARVALGLDRDKTVIAVLPGSRASEVSRLAQPFLDAMRICLSHKPDIQIVVPLINEQTRQIFQQAHDRCGYQLPITLVDGRSREVMTAADIVLLASGTAALEAMLLKKPMVVAYRLSALSYPLVRLLLNVKNVSLPNLLAGQRLVPELIQQQVTGQRLADEILDLLQQPALINTINQRFTEIHLQLKCNASQQAAAAIHNFMQNL